MTDRHAFPGFPGVGRATAIPNAFFAAVLPQMRAPEDLLAFLWVARLAQDQKGEARFVTADQVWRSAADSFDTMAGGRPGLERGLDACAELGALAALRVSGAACDQVVYFVNNPASRRTIARARAGELELVPETIATTVTAEARPGIFRLYEEQVGTITPLIGERLIEAQDTYSAEWIEEAFATAAAMNVRNWRYIERILQRWAEEGRANEAPGRDPFEEQKQRYLGGSLGNIVHHR